MATVLYAFSMILLPVPCFLLPVPCRSQITPQGSASAFCTHTTIVRLFDVTYYILSNLAIYLTCMCIFNITHTFIGYTFKQTLLSNYFSLVLSPTHLLYNYISNCILVNLCFPLNHPPLQPYTSSHPPTANNMPFSYLILPVEAALR